MTRRSMLVLALMSLCFGVTMLRAADAPKVETTEGSIKSVNADQMTFVLSVGPKHDKDATVTCDKDTKFLDSDAKEVKMADVVKQDAKVKVTVTDGKASKVEAYTCACDK